MSHAHTMRHRRGYVKAVLEEANEPRVLLIALRHVAHAR
jgi:hypothetical protein